MEAEQVNPESSENKGDVASGDPFPGIQGPGVFPIEVRLPAVFQRAYQASVCIGEHMFTGILDNQGPHHEQKGTADSGLQGPVEFRRVQKDSAVDQYAYEASACIEGHKFTGILDDQGPHHELKDPGEDSGSKETEKCTETSGNITIDDPSSDRQEEESIFNPEISGVKGQVTIDKPSAENTEGDSGSKETEQEPEASGSKGQVPIDNSYSENTEEKWGSKYTEQEPEASGSKGKITIDDPSSSGNSESSRPRERTMSYELLEFPYGPLLTATRNFADQISEGYYGALYRGTLSDPNQEVAVKRLNNVVTGFSNNDIAKVAHGIGRVNHTNIVKFVGYCNEKLDRHILIYEFIPTTLASYLHGSPPQMPPLDWATRMKILHGVAKALHCLHRTVKPRIIYGDLQSSNILLDAREGFLNPKLCGFGFGKLKHTGYCAPVHADDDEVSTDCDVHSFGMVFLEMLTGRKAYDATRGSKPWLFDWVRDRLKLNGESKGVQDPALKGKVEHSTFGKALAIALFFCINKFASTPDIEEVLAQMEYFTGQKVDDRPYADFISENLESEAAEEEDDEKETNKDKKKGNKKTQKKK